jgi:hypothetical protein
MDTVRFFDDGYLRRTGMGVSRELTARQLAGQPDGAIEQIGVVVLPDGRMSRADTARYIGCTTQTLAAWAMKKIGPPQIKVGGKSFYRKNEVDRFIRGDGEAV